MVAFPTAWQNLRANISALAALYVNQCALEKEVNKMVDPSNGQNTSENHDNLDNGNQVVNTYENNTEKNANESPVELWISKSPVVRKPEVEYLQSFNPEFPVSISERGNLQKPFKAGPWTFLMELDKSFPKPTEDNRLPIRVYLVMPNANEIMQKFQMTGIPNVKKDPSGSEYLVFAEMKQELKDYNSGRFSEELLVEKMVKHTNDWVSSLAQSIKQHYKPAKNQVPFLWTLFGFQSHNNALQETQSFGRAKYMDGRNDVTGEINPRCKKVVLSDRAYSQIFSETYSKIRTETGGLLLGHFENGVWYVVEASDPGINATFTTAYHEGDDVYENHICGVISRMYKHPLVFIGMWHRHPGSLDVFSGTDDQTNYKYAESAGNGCISALVNIDPNFRITFYYVEQGRYQGDVFYTKVDVEVGNDRFENPEIFMLASSDDILRRTRNGG